MSLAHQINQTPSYKESVLSAAVVARVSVEVISTFGWERYVGSKGKAVEIDKFGVSAPVGIFYEFVLTCDNVVSTAKQFFS